MEMITAASRLFFPNLDPTSELATRSESGWAIWAIQDRFALNAGEEKAIELKREIVVGQERVAWNPALTLPTKEFEFSDHEIARIKAAMQTCDSYGAAADRNWLQPLLDLLFSAEARP
jgi:hypothetical protein